MSAHLVLAGKSVHLAEVASVVEHELDPREQLLRFLHRPAVTLPRNVDTEPPATTAFSGLSHPVRPQPQNGIHGRLQSLPSRCFILACAQSVHTHTHTHTHHDAPLSLFSSPLLPTHLGVVVPQSLERLFEHLGVVVHVRRVVVLRLEALQLQMVLGHVRRVEQQPVQQTLNHAQSNHVTPGLELHFSHHSFNEQIWTQV